MYEIFSKLLEEHGVKAADVCRGTGLPSSLFSEWKRGKSTPKPDKLQKIADFFGVPLSYLLTGEMEESVKDTVLSTRDERDISRRLEKTLFDLENQQGALMFDGDPLDEETKELLKASLEHSITVAKINAKKFTNKRFIDPDKQR